MEQTIKIKEFEPDTQKGIEVMEYEKQLANEQQGIEIVAHIKKHCTHCGKCKCKKQQEHTM